MIHFLREVRILKREGKLHRKLIFRMRMLFVISLILLGIVAFNLVFRAVNPLIALAMAAVGFFLGLRVFSRMNPVSWNEQEAVVQADRMDKIGYATLAAYIAFEISFRTFLDYSFPLSATAFLFAGIFGTIFGRAVGTVLTIHKVFQATHAAADRNG